MAMGAGELLLIVLILAMLGYTLAVPIVGIVRAVRRRDQGGRSTGAVVWPSINLGLFGVGAVVSVIFGGLPVAPGIGIALNGIWLYLAIATNRAAAREGTGA